MHNTTVNVVHYHDNFIMPISVVPGVNNNVPDSYTFRPRRLGQKVKLHHSQAREVVTLSGTRRLVH